MDKKQRRRTYLLSGAGGCAIGRTVGRAVLSYVEKMTGILLASSPAVARPSMHPLSIAQIDIDHILPRGLEDLV